MFYTRIILLSLLYCSSAFAQELIKPAQKPPWYDNIVAETYGYAWFTDGDLNHKHLGVDPGPVYWYSKLKYETDSNLYIVGGETGYKFDLLFLKRITTGYEVAQGSSSNMHGIDVDPDFSDPARTNFLGYFSYQKHSGRDSNKYISPALYIRPLEGKITKSVAGYFDIFGEWIRYKDRAVIETVTQEREWFIIYDFVPNVIPPYTFEAAPNPWKIRYEGAGLGCRGGLEFFDMFKLEGRFAYYPDMSVKETVLWDVPINRKFVFFNRNGNGLRARVKLGFVPPFKGNKERKHLELDIGYQYMQFGQNDGRGRVFRFSDGASANIDDWERASSYRDGFFVGGTIRW